MAQLASLAKPGQPTSATSLPAVFTRGGRGHRRWLPRQRASPWRPSATPRRLLNRRPPLHANPSSPHSPSSFSSRPRLHDPAPHRTVVALSSSSLWSAASLRCATTSWSFVALAFVSLTTGSSPGPCIAPFPTSSSSLDRTSGTPSCSASRLEDP